MRISFKGGTLVLAVPRYLVSHAREGSSFAASTDPARQLDRGKVRGLELLEKEIYVEESSCGASW